MVRHFVLLFIFWRFTVADIYFDRDIPPPPAPPPPPPSEPRIELHEHEHLHLHNHNHQHVHEHFDDEKAVKRSEEPMDVGDSQSTRPRRYAYEDSYYSAYNTYSPYNYYYTSSYPGSSYPSPYGSYGSAYGGGGAYPGAYYPGMYTGVGSAWGAQGGLVGNIVSFLIG